MANLQSRQKVQPEQQQSSWMCICLNCFLVIFIVINPHNELMRHDFAWHRKCVHLSGHCCSEELANNSANHFKLKLERLQTSCT